MLPDELPREVNFLHVGILHVRHLRITCKIRIRGDRLELLDDVGREGDELIGDGEEEGVSRAQLRRLAVKCDGVSGVATVEEKLSGE